MVKNKITYLMLTYNRQNYALRTLKYYSNKEVDILVLDASRESINIKLIENLGKNIKYIHNTSDYITRLKFGIEIIDTEYVALMADEEFYSIEGTLKLTKFLDENEEYSSVVGESISFKKIRNKCVLSDGYKWQNYEVKNNDPCERMKFHMNPYYFTSIYGVVRRSVYSKAIESLPNKKEFSIDFELFFEMHFELSVVFQGKVKVLDTYFQLKSYELDSQRNSNDPFIELKGLTNYEWITEEKYAAELNQYAKNFSDYHYNKVQSKEYINMNLLEAIKLWSQTDFPIKNKVINKSNKIKNSLIKIYQKLPLLLQNKIKKSIFKIRKNSLVVIWRYPNEYMLKSEKKKNEINEIISIINYIDSCKIN